MNSLEPIVRKLPILILFPHSRCNCRCVMCDIWKITAAEEISVEELAGYADDIASLGVEWVVFSGGEPLMHSDLFRLAEVLGEREIRTSLLTTGLLLRKNAARVVEGLGDVIVSLDGPPGVHDAIRRVSGAYGRLADGVRALHELSPGYPVTGRCTVQQANHRYLRDTVKTARELGLASISFLAADLTSGAFNRGDGWPDERQGEVGLSVEETRALGVEVEAVIRERKDDVASGYIRESPEKLRRIVRHFEARIGLAEPSAPSCNDPWVSAVVETDGTLRPCFFHQPIGNVRTQGLAGALNSVEAVAFRERLRVAEDPVCRRCTCSLNWRGEDGGGGTGGCGFVRTSPGPLQGFPR